MTGICQEEYLPAESFLWGEDISPAQQLQRFCPQAVGFEKFQNQAVGFEKFQRFSCGLSTKCIRRFLRCRLGPSLGGHLLSLSSLPPPPLSPPLPLPFPLHLHLPPPTTPLSPAGLGHLRLQPHLRAHGQGHRPGPAHPLPGVPSVKRQVRGPGAGGARGRGGKGQGGQGAGGMGNLI
jgi:hypothetical protein